MTVSDLHIVEDGEPDAPPVLFVNSLGTDHRMWDAQVEPLTRSHRILRADTRGHGRSRTTRGPYTVAQLGADVLRVLDDRAIERADVVGLSLGGLTALWLAVHHPDRVRRLILADTAARVGTREGWEARIAAIHAGGMAAVADTVVARFVSPSFPERDPRTTSTLRDTLLATDPDGYIACCLALADADLRPVAAQVRAPTLVIVGSEDVATPVAESRWLADTIAGARLAIIDGAGHLANVERPDVFNDLLLDFLQESA